MVETFQIERFIKLIQNSFHHHKIQMALICGQRIRKTKKMIFLHFVKDCQTAQNLFFLFCLIHVFSPKSMYKYYLYMDFGLGLQFQTPVQEASVSEALFSSSKDRLPSKVVFHQRVSSIKQNCFKESISAHFILHQLQDCWCQLIQSS